MIIDFQQCGADDLAESVAADSDATTCTQSALLLVRPPEKNCADDNEKEVRKPDEQIRMNFRVGAHRVGDDDEEEIKNRDEQAHGEADRGLAPMRGDT